jgi:hypothetical protein
MQLLRLLSKINFQRIKVKLALSFFLISGFTVKNLISSKLVKNKNTIGAKKNKTKPLSQTLFEFSFSGEFFS